MFLQTPLHCALIDGKEESVKLLVEHGANLYIPDGRGLPPLSLARSLGRADFISALETENGK